MLKLGAESGVAGIRGVGTSPDSVAHLERLRPQHSTAATVDRAGAPPVEALSPPADPALMSVQKPAGLPACCPGEARSSCAGWRIRLRPAAEALAPPALPPEVGRPPSQVGRRRVHDLLELERLPRTSRIECAHKLVAQLQVQADPLRLSDFSRKQLGSECPCDGVEIHNHVIARTQRFNVSNLQKPWPDAIQLVGELSRPRVVCAAAYLDRRVGRGKFEAGRALQVDVTPLRLGQQPPAHEHHRAILEP
eukprot:1122709-Prymnesium_polylepis.2